MNDYEDFVSVKQLIDDGKLDRSDVIRAADSQTLSLAIWANGFSITQYPVDKKAEFKLSDGEWLYVWSKYMRNFEGHHRIGMGKFRSAAEADVDRFAFVGSGDKPMIAIEEMFIRQSDLHVIDGGAPAIAGEQKAYHFYPMADGHRWAIGTAKQTSNYKKSDAFAHFVTAARNPGEDVVRQILGGTENTYIPTYSAEDEMDPQYIKDVQGTLSDLKESLKLAEDEGELELAEEYGIEIKRIEKVTQQSLITSKRSRLLNDGDTLIRETKRLRSAKIRMIKKIEKEQPNIAAHIDTHYNVGDRYVVYSPSGNTVKWVLDPPD